jgi:hypothetical protein
MRGTAPSPTSAAHRHLALTRWPEFMDLIQRRLEGGRIEHGGRSLTRAADDLVGEIEEELLDVVGWAFPLWCRLRKLRERLKELEASCAAD